MELCGHLYIITGIIQPKTFAENSKNEVPYIAIIVITVFSLIVLVCCYIPDIINGS